MVARQAAALRRPGDPDATTGGPSQVESKKIGLRSVTVRRGLLRLNNRPINLRGASIHEDMPGHGAALTGRDMDTIVRELKEVGANVTRAHYVLSEGLLQRLDRAGIMVWNEAPVWQRDGGGALLKFPTERARAYAQVERTVKAARSHPSVITHATANELALAPDRRPSTRTFLRIAATRARAASTRRSRSRSTSRRGRASRSSSPTRTTT